MPLDRELVVRLDPRQTWTHVELPLSEFIEAREGRLPKQGTAAEGPHMDPGDLYVDNIRVMPGQF